MAESGAGARRACTDGLTQADLADVVATNSIKRHNVLASVVGKSIEYGSL